MLKFNWVYLLLTVFVWTAATSWTQQSDNQTQEKIEIDPFKLTIVTRNYSMHLFEGDSKYILTENKLQIINVSSIGEVETLLISQPLKPSTTLQIFSKMNLDIFDDFYDNSHLVTTSGQAIVIEYEKKDHKKKIFIHCYYSKHLAIMAHLFNELIPAQYKIDLCHI